jgi:hypothetical protein
MAEAQLPEILQSLAKEIERLAFPPDQQPPMPQSAQAVLDTVRDPYTGSENQRAVLRDAAGKKLGQVQFNSDGGFYAEFDVIRNHPSDPRWFVEGVAAWGQAGNIKSEAKLLPALQ